MPFKTNTITSGESSLRPDVPTSVPIQSWEVLPLNPNGGKRGPGETVGSLKRAPTPESDEDAVKRLKLTVLAPFFDRIRQDGEENKRLRQMNAELAVMNERQQKQLAVAHDSLNNSPVQHQLQEALEPRGQKRKGCVDSPMKMGACENGDNEHTAGGHLVHLARQISKDLVDVVPNETIHFCGLGPLKIIDSRPDDVLELAHQKLHTWPYKNVPMCWRRLYEDAALTKAVSMLHEEADRIDAVASFKRRRLKVNGFHAERPSPEWLTEIVTVLDKGITLTGAPGRAAVFETLLQQLENHHASEPNLHIAPTLSTVRQKDLQSDHQIPRSKQAMKFEAFQLHLDRVASPIIISGLMSTWPAIKLWHNPSYLLRVTLGGRRSVPVEVGQSYLDDGWSQRMMPFKDFLTDFLLDKEPKEVGYLAQHDLFAQIPALKNDITIPDYCYTSPPDPDGAAAHTAGLASAPRLDQPLLNAWLGPKGTKTPLHTDPYHNILCQVVGYKYVRLYSPNEAPRLYPCGVDDNGIDMSNSSQVDISHFRTTALDSKPSTDGRSREEEHRKFPLLKDAKFEEAIIGPGESLYIPLGWWHYVESLSTSFSVSFWWN